MKKSFIYSLLLAMCMAFSVSAVTAQDDGPEQHLSKKQEVTQVTSTGSIVITNSVDELMCFTAVKAYTTNLTHQVSDITYATPFVAEVISVNGSEALSNFNDTANGNTGKKSSVILTGYTYIPLKLDKLLCS